MPETVLQINDLKGKIGEYLPLADLNSMVASSWEHYKFFQPRLNKKKVVSFLLSVAYGKQEIAQALLDSEVKTSAKLKKNISLPFEKASFTDYSFRTFNCTGFEYAYWAGDIHMCRMIVNGCKDPLLLGKLFEACLSVKKNGLNYTQYENLPLGQDLDAVYKVGEVVSIEELFSRLLSRGKIKLVEKNSERFCFHLLFDAMTLCDANMNDIHVKKLWQRQAELPVHVINEFAHPARDFIPIPSFKEQILPRNVFFDLPLTMDSKRAFFPLYQHNVDCLPVLRSPTIKAVGTVSTPKYLYCTGYNEKGRYEIKVLQKLRDLRIEEMEQLYTRLGALSINSWSTTQVEKWLLSLGSLIERAAPLFRDIDGSRLCALTNEDLTALGCSPLTRRLLLSHRENLVKFKESQAWVQEAAPDESVGRIKL